MPKPSTLTVRHIGLEAVSTRSGGLNRYFAALVRAENNEGINAEGIVLGGADVNGASGDGLTAVGSMTDSAPRRLAAMFRAAVRRPLPDLVDSHFALYAALPAITRLRRLPLVVHFQGPWAEESAAEGGSSAARQAKALLERLVYRRADAAVVLSNEFGEMLADRYGVSPFVITRLDPGVDLMTFRHGPQNEARAKLGIAENRKLVICVRRLRRRMGIDVAIRALDHLDEETTLVIVGTGPERKTLEELASTSGADIRFVGHVSDEELVTWYQAADVSIVPSVALEGFGLIVLESLACGTPVVASDLGGLRDALWRFDPEALVEAGNPLELSQGITRALEHPDPESRSAAARRYAEDFSWSSVAARHRELYGEVIARRQGKTRPRVVVVGHTAQLSGGELAMARLLPSLMVDCDVRVILGQHGPLVDRLRSLGVAVEVLAMDERARSLSRDRATASRLPGAALTGTLRYVISLARRLRQINPDIVHTNTLKAALYGGVAGRMARVGVVWHLRDRLADDYMNASTARLIRTLAPRFADGIIANSEATLATLGQILLPTAVIPSPLDPSILPTASGRRVRRIGMIGRISPWKGQVFFLEAFARAFGEGDEIAVLVGAPLFGEEDYDDEVTAAITSLGLMGRVERRGFRDDVNAELQRLDVVVHASTVPEPFGQVVVEAMAAGRPVVAANAGGPAETITDGIDGVLYELGDVGALAKAMIRVAGDDELRSRVVANGLVTAERYRPSVLSRDVVDLYRKILGVHD